MLLATICDAALPPPRRNQALSDRYRELVLTSEASAVNPGMVIFTTPCGHKTDEELGSNQDFLT
jgi:hypothetical protein